jgi:hypothetical protein
MAGEPSLHRNFKSARSGLAMAALPSRGSSTLQCRAQPAVRVKEKYRHFLQFQRMVADAQRAAGKPSVKPWPL